MKTNSFDAAVDFSPKGRQKRMDAVLWVRGERMPASFHFYDPLPKDKLTPHFVRVHTHQALSLGWKDGFTVQESGKRRVLGKGQVLYPSPEKVTRAKVKKRIALLEALQGDKKNMLLALAQDKGIRGLGEKEIRAFSSSSWKSILRVTQELEGEGQVRILSFDPLFLLSQESFNFLCQKIIEFLAHFHEKYPEQSGASQERIQRRFDLHPRVLSLALKHLIHTGQAKESAGKLSLPDFNVVITSDDERILKELEEMCLKGDFRLFSLEDLRRHFKLTTKKLDSMLSLLIERRKIVQGKDGLLLHSKWLDEIIKDIRKSGKREMTIAEFKELTGLTRKYAIPLLELLDQIGVTRRKGSLREIL
ncbi:MAG: SelB C-terminal domain-containing protein [Candidatus Aminicenantes bacterium]|jgi:selenocysteine-specific elongation factor